MIRFDSPSDFILLSILSGWTCLCMTVWQWHCFSNAYFKPRITETWHAISEGRERVSCISFCERILRGSQVVLSILLYPLSIHFIFQVHTWYRDISRPFNGSHVGNISKIILIGTFSFFLHAIQPWLGSFKSKIYTKGPVRNPWSTEYRELLCWKYPDLWVGMGCTSKWLLIWEKREDVGAGVAKAADIFAV